MLIRVFVCVATGLCPNEDVHAWFPLGMVSYKLGVGSKYKRDRTEVVRKGDSPPRTTHVFLQLVLW